MNNNSQATPAPRRASTAETEKRLAASEKRLQAAMQVIKDEQERQRKLRQSLLEKKSKADRAARTRRLILLGTLFDAMAQCPRQMSLAWLQHILKIEKVLMTFIGESKNPPSKTQEREARDFMEALGYVRTLIETIQTREPLAPDAQRWERREPVPPQDTTAPKPQPNPIMPPTQRPEPEAGAA